MQTIVDSTSPPSLPHKVVHKPKHKRGVSLAEEFPDELCDYIVCIDVKVNTHCGYRLSVTLLGKNEESWALIHDDLIREL